MREVVIASAVRTGIGSFQGALAPLSGPELGAIAVREAVLRAGIAPEQVDEVLLGNVYQAGERQAPARQAALKAGLPVGVPCTTINKVCASGLKAVQLGVHAIQAGDADVVVAGGFESMSNVPYYVLGARRGYRLGHAQLVDGLLHDGLEDAYEGCHMGNAAELCARTLGISRQEQDAYAVRSYERALRAHREGWFEEELVTVEVPQPRGEPLRFREDEELRRVNFDKIPQLKPAFEENGTVTAANASKINDGAAALVLMSAEKARALGLNPMARVVAQADAEREPLWFTLAPVDAISKVLRKAGWTVSDVDLFEINEAFAVVAIADSRQLGISSEKLNVHGGAVALGHPVGCSGARILVTLLHALRIHGGRRGVAGICNGGGGASALAVELL
ncbi:MAG: acetyl-CoA C-acyltransferase [Bacteroidetes bacterium]|nr:acetyl-CoA C-acyltransferase [Rhodothermia bacterium]MCS7155538.1 acetyl-CoA C-acyltransferase [Bacteroidota bacterium]MCX7907369.1 acetyl-CoA C-acyltransferase [Bacteroidota bacterium]MDW8138363.1 acetyl-CoA C-acyltransferase [Bacteroidota bacterium]MDW8284700.1 acetyl-CoA C-acyltransferase [Bacteroidota bacterium]